MEMINRLVVALRENGLGLRKERVAEYQRGIQKNFYGDRLFCMVLGWWTHDYMHL